MAILILLLLSYVVDIRQARVSNGLTYVQMVKLLKPEHSLGFISVMV